MQTLEQWLDHIGRIHPKTIELGLERAKKVADKLNLSSWSCPVITIAGTNGKGSCVALTEQILLAAGYRTASYTSPHLLKVNERIRIAGQMIGDASLCQALATIDDARDDMPLTYFEFMTLAALFLFRQEEAEVLILEVGLGGRLDAVNIVDPDIAVISSIGIDHTDYLGFDRESIAREKAGIMRAQTPTVCGDPMPPQSLLAIAKTLDAPLYCLGRDYEYQLDGAFWRFSSMLQTLDNLPQPQILLQNAACVLMALSLLKVTVPSSAIRQGLQEVKLSGRFQVIDGPVRLILDVAHNPDSAQVLANNLQQQPQAGKTYAVWSMLADKDLNATLNPMLACIDQWFCAPLPEERAATIEQLEQVLQSHGRLDYVIVDTIEAAYQQAMKTANRGDQVVVFGSFHTVAQVLQVMV